ncbi:guanine nucleotide-binding protein (G protein), subunit alpha [Oopsacas minuta]|uniref:Guanine nucleotide-binding protein alpha-16 subunit n=1 Tax=Oopsacas minuta TaxID=111878 RepID=A0AAV7JYI6_9METZ|nr:guanine nucleotide-binding protein (G protein), subunit alpha [Oopsacas minuta]
MGCKPSSVEDKVAKQRSKGIDTILKKDKKLFVRECKILLLGPGESGKSTILKQMKIIHDNGYGEEERENHRDIVFSNCVTSLRAILRGREMLQIPYGDVDRDKDEETFYALMDTGVSRMIDPNLAVAMNNLWSDAGVQDAFKNSNKYQLNDSAEFFLNALERISERGYIPSVEDVLRTRVQTLGVVEFNFTYKGLNFLMVDVGGQKTERKKWIHCFEDVKALMFIVALSDYDLTLREDDETNRMLDSMDLFDSICNNQYFRNTSIMLFLNKQDKFMQKLQYSKLNTCFPDYAGDNSFESSSAFVRRKFESLNKSKDKNGEMKVIYTHFTCATDTGSIQFVFDCVTDIIIRINLGDVI